MEKELREELQDIADKILAFLEEKDKNMFPVSECCNAGAALVTGTEKGLRYYICSNCKQVCELAEWSKPKCTCAKPEHDTPERNIWVAIGQILRNQNALIEYLEARR